MSAIVGLMCVVCVSSAANGYAHESEPMDESSSHGEHELVNTTREEQGGLVVLPVTRYPMVPRHGEVLWQLGGTAAITFLPAVMASLIPVDEFDLVDVSRMSAVMVALAPPIVYGLGRSNASNASFGATFAGGAMGAGAVIASYAILHRFRPYYRNEVAAYYAISIGLPIIGAVTGYQLTSTWSDGETVHEKSPATARSLYLLPTPHGVSMGGGFVF